MINKVSGYIISTGLMLAAIAWSADPSVGSWILFFGALTVFGGTIKDKT